MASKRITSSPTSWQTQKSPLNVYREGLRDALGRSGKTLRAMRRAVNEYGAGVLDVDDEAVKVWSDLHLGHANIIGYQDRPFHDVHEMNGTLWANWQLWRRRGRYARLRRRLCARRGTLGRDLGPGQGCARPLEDSRCRQSRHHRPGPPESRGVSPDQGVVGFPRGSAADLDSCPAAKRAGRARQHSRPHAPEPETGGLTAYQRLCRATRLPADRTVPAATSCANALITGQSPPRERRRLSGSRQSRGV